MLRARQRFDKYRIVRRVAEGGFAHVFEAFDTIEGIPVALKIPRDELISDQALEDFRREVRLTAQLDHPNILHIKNASFIDGKFVIVYPLAERTLADRMEQRMPASAFLHYAGQMIDALDHAHRRNIIHCDIKPDNMLIFAEDRLRIADFGIAKFALQTLNSTRSGTLGYLAPEQAMGRPRKGSDVFSLGLILWEMLARRLPEWPFDWPPAGVSAIRRKMPQEMLVFLRRSLEIDTRKRFRDGREMKDAWVAMLPRIERHYRTRRTSRHTGRR